MRRLRLIWNAPPETRGIRWSQGVTKQSSTLKSSNKMGLTMRLLEVQPPEEKDYFRKRPRANTAILVCWMIIMIALLFMVEVHIRKLSIHTFALCSPLPSEMEVQIVGEHAVAGVIPDMNVTMDRAIEKLLTPARVADGIRKHLGY